MKSKISLTLAVAAIVASLAGATIAPAASAAPKKADAASILATPITGTVGNLAYSVTPTVTGFTNQQGQLVANGNLVGTVTNTLTGVVTTDQPGILGAGHERCRRPGRARSSTWFSARCTSTCSAWSSI